MGGHVVQTGRTLEIKGNVGGEKYTCTATNTVKGKETSLNKTITVTEVINEPGGGGGCSAGCIAGATCGCLAVCGIAAGVGVVVVKKKKSRK
jgi:hypothetical protein